MALSPTPPLPPSTSSVSPERSWARSTNPCLAHAGLRPWYAGLRGTRGAAAWDTRGSSLGCVAAEQAAGGWRQAAGVPARAVVELEASRRVWVHAGRRREAFAGVDQRKLCEATADAGPEDLPRTHAHSLGAHAARWGPGTLVPAASSLCLLAHSHVGDALADLNHLTTDLLARRERRVLAHHVLPRRPHACVSGQESDGRMWAKERREDARCCGLTLPSTTSTSGKARPALRTRTSAVPGASSGLGTLHRLRTSAYGPICDATTAFIGDPYFMFGFRGEDETTSWGGRQPTSSRSIESPSLLNFPQKSAIPALFF